MIKQKDQKFYEQSEKKGGPSKSVHKEKEPAKLVPHWEAQDDAENDVFYENT